MTLTSSRASESTSGGGESSLRDASMSSTSSCAVAVSTPTRHRTLSSSWTVASRLHSSADASCRGSAFPTRNFVRHRNTPSSVHTTSRHVSPPKEGSRPPERGCQLCQRIRITRRAATASVRSTSAMSPPARAASRVMALQLVVLRRRASSATDRREPAPVGQRERPARRCCRRRSAPRDGPRTKAAVAATTSHCAQVAAATVTSRVPVRTGSPVAGASR